MPKQQSRKKSPPRRTPKPGAGLEKALAGQTKGDLVNLVMEIARDNAKIMRRLESRFQVASSPKELIADTRRAIANATDFDERDINYNFDYDYEAYETVNRNFGLLVQGGQLREAMKLSLELMAQGSYQVEMSDEGMMTDEIEECLRVVIKALPKSDLPAKEIIAWRREMEQKDRVKFIGSEELKSLEKRYQQ